VPCFNLEHYIDDTLFSVRNEFNDSIEFLFIDDGSIDLTIYKLDEFFKLNNNKNVYVFKTRNKGQSAARNFGISKAVGKYVWFLDGDDVLVLGSINNLLELVNLNSDCDLIAFQGYDFEDYLLGNQIINYTPKNKYLIESYNRFIDTIIITDSRRYLVARIKANEFIENPCFYIFRREIVLENSIYFTEGMVYEDVCFTVRLFLASKILVLSPIRPILHRRRNGSTMRSVLSGHHIYSGFRVVEELYSLKKQEKNAEEIEILVEKYLYRALNWSRKGGFNIYLLLLKHRSILPVIFRSSEKIRVEFHKNLKQSIKLF
jgi:glycosyltransferase involved in cell wall biosynthesis